MVDFNVSALNGVGGTSDPKKRSGDVAKPESNLSIYGNGFFRGELGTGNSKVVNSEEYMLNGRYHTNQTLLYQDGTKVYTSTIMNEDSSVRITQEHVSHNGDILRQFTRLTNGNSIEVIYNYDENNKFLGTVEIYRNADGEITEQKEYPASN